MSTPRVSFSVAIIARNEEKTLPRLLKSLEEFRARGGEVICLDTGSTDKTAKIARDWGCVVEEVGSKFLKVVDEGLARKINRQFLCIEDKDKLKKELIVSSGDKNFDFASARNYCASLASNDMIATPDADELYTKLDIDTVNKHIEDGYDQLEFNFVFAHGPNGEETIKFKQCKFYNRKKLAIRADKAIVKHYHFSKGYELDAVYKIGWSKVEEDRKLLKEKLKLI